MNLSAAVASVIIGADMIGVNVVTSGDIWVAVSQNEASFVERQNIFVAVFVPVFRSLSDRAGLVAAMGLDIGEKELGII